MHPVVKKVLPLFLMIGTMGAADFTGTWKLNPEKSQLGSRDVTQQTLPIKQTGPNTYTSVVDIVTKSGEKQHQEIVRICDGKEHPSTRAAAAKGAVLNCQIGPGPTRKLVEKADGKVVSEMTSTLSEDGKLMTNVFKYRDGDETLVYERQ